MGMDEKQHERISLYLYDELELEEREAFESEIEASPELAAAVESERAFLNRLNARETAPPESLLVECRHDLMREVYREERATRRESSAGGFLAWGASLIGGLGGLRAVWQPAAALTLMALGFWGGRYAETLQTPTSEPAATIASSGKPVLDVSRVSLGSNAVDVRSIDLEPGQDSVEIVVEERRTIRGASSDPFIRSLLLSSVRNADSGNRLTSLKALGLRAEDPEVRQALARAMVEDENPGVRFKALEAVAPYSKDPYVRSALMTAVRQDDNPGMRVQAIELLTANPDRELVGLLQTLVREEPNSYVRLRCQQTLQELDASIEQF
jgi:hypothetical protein